MKVKVALRDVPLPDAYLRVPEFAIYLHHISRQLEISEQTGQQLYLTPSDDLIIHRKRLPGPFQIY